MKEKIKILIAEDSPVIAALLKSMIHETDDMHVIAIAKNGAEAVEFTKQYKPNLITMDIQMPIKNGFEATKEIMADCPTPIVVISSHANSASLNTTFNALQSGALTVIEKPSDILSAGFSVQKNTILNTLRALSEVRVIRRRFGNLPDVDLPVEKKKITSLNDLKIVALGSSTGGPEALYFILSQIPDNFSLPIVIVQHITDGFLPGLITWLQRKSALPIEMIAENNQPLLPGHVYFAPDGMHLGIKKGEATPIAFFERSDPIDYFRPSVSYLFSSIAESYPKQALAGLLTGMGRDGASGLLKMKESGSHTFIQSESSCVVFGMPGVAKRIGAECDIIDLMKIPEYIKKIIK